MTHTPYTSRFDSYQEAFDASELVSKELKESGNTIEFQGINDCTDILNDGKSADDAVVECDGWDGNERRCECGNRRVSWDFEKVTGKEVWYFIARAY